MSKLWTKLAAVIIITKKSNLFQSGGYMVKVAV